MQILLCFGVGVINGLGAAIECVVIAALLTYFQEQLIRCADSTLIAVGDIYQQRAAIDFHHIPHMGTGAGAALHIAVHQMAFHIAFKFGQIAQIFERLGVAFADHIGGGIAVEYIDQLPGISVGCGIIICSGMIIADQLADLVSISRQLIPVGFCRVLGNDGLCGVDYAVRCSDLRGIGGIGAAGIIFGHSKFEGNAGDFHLGAIGASIGQNGNAGDLIIPKQLIGAFRHKRIVDPIKLDAFGKLGIKCAGCLRSNAAAGYDISNAQFLLCPLQDAVGIADFELRGGLGAVGYGSDFCL